MPRNRLNFRQWASQIRSLQAVAARQKASAAQRELTKSEREKGEATQRLALKEDAWKEAICAPSLDVNLVTVWCASVVEERAVLEAAEYQSTLHEQAFVVASQDYAFARQRHDDAVQEERRAVREAQRSRDERLIAEVEDLRLARMERSC